MYHSFLHQLLQFLRQLENRLPVDQSVFNEMSVADRRNFILGRFFVFFLDFSKYLIDANLWSFFNQGFCSPNLKKNYL